MQRKSALQRTNIVILRILTTLNIFLILGYFVEYLKGEKSLAYILVFFLILTLPLGIAYAIYFKNKKSHQIKYITITGYFIMYTFIMFTSDNPNVFVYIFPIVLIYYLYNNLQLMIVSAGVSIAINILAIITKIIQGPASELDSSSLTLQLATVFIYCYSIIISSKLSIQFNKENLEDIHEEKEKQEEILGDVLKTASILDKNSKEVSTIVTELSSATDYVSKAVNEIALGAESSSQNINIQSDLTHDIRNRVKETSEASDQMSQYSSNTSTVAEEGLTIINSLGEISTRVNANTENTYQSINELKNHLDDIYGILNIITDISEQTNLLSLNASIESARAGEAGKGFAIVADEIRKLASQSKQSTENISEILNLLRIKSESAVNEVINLKTLNADQNTYIKSTQDVFHNIMDNITQVNDNVNLVNNKVNQVLDANDKLVESIDAISSVSEETTATTEEASSLSTQNIEKAQQARKLVEELIETSKEMKKYMD